MKWVTKKKQRTDAGCNRFQNRLKIHNIEECSFISHWIINLEKKKTELRIESYDLNFNEIIFAVLMSMKYVAKHKLYFVEKVEICWKISRVDSDPIA